ncbi:hypothetical protein [Rhizobium azibense]|uniref:RecT family protein n=1 Tax=Rhizobium azibense TaxID=1136135 RepID=A0A4R3REU4_9HYPH|nr:hypothetical protein [Rhizobium azibense]TCU34053.1 hypothetical protein EV129_11336 [Rhizobium azibense]
MNDFVTTQEPEVYRPSAAINPERLEYLWTLATKLANTSLVPESLRTEGSRDSKKDLPIETVIGNVFAVCEQADRWNQSPFALLSCAAIVHGKLGFEGKVIAAVLEANFGIVLHHYYTGEPKTDSYHIYLCDQPLPEDIVSNLYPGIRVPGYRIMDGSVSGWKTTGNGSPWRPDTYAKMLVYRGSREWSRIYKPAAVMGVLADDELVEIANERRALQARDVTTPSLTSRFGGQTNDGFNANNVTKQLEHAGAMPMDHIDAKTGEIIEQTSGATVAASGTARKSAAGTSTNSSSSTSSSLGDDDKSGGRTHSSSQRAAAGTFEEFSSALLRFGGTGNGRDADVEKITKASDAFWGERGGKPSHEADADLCRKIIGIHLRRMVNEINIDATKSEVKALVEKSFAL